MLYCLYAYASLQKLKMQLVLAPFYNKCINNLASQSWLFFSVEELMQLIEKTSFEDIYHQTIHLTPNESK